MTNSVKNQEKHRTTTENILVTLLILFLVVFAAMTFVAYLHGDGTPYATGYELGKMIGVLTGKITFNNGIGIGSVIAMLASWERNKSIRWVILHAVFGWLYVFYFIGTRNGQNNTLK